MTSTIGTAALRFGELLHRHRQAAGLTQAELAERACLSRRGINDLERGVRQTPRKDTVALLAQALGLSDAEHAAFEAAARHTRVAAPPANTASPPPAGQSDLTTPALPTGTVTFLFTDIDGSTRLLQQLGAARYAQVRTAHEQLLRTAFAAHGGHEVDTQGDSFFVAFPTAHGALAAAAEAQEALAVYPWPAGAVLRVRMGLHIGTAQVAGERYVGLDVHRAARIAAAGHGGQVLLSEAVRVLVEPELPDGATLRDLGTHRLKDLQHPEHVFQLVLPDLPGLPADFPPLNALGRDLHNLPVQPTPLLGRQREVAEVVMLLRREDVRLVTLTGPGGVGKTRLGLQVAAELVDDHAFGDGVWLVRLSRLVDPALVVPTIAHTLGLKEAGSRPIEELLREHLRARRLLLLLDNVEQVVAAVPQVADLLASSPGLVVLATSRVRLHLQGEREMQVPPLALPANSSPTGRPPQSEHLLEAPAVALFIERAQAHRSDFALTEATGPVVAAICARLDGLPLAIELAAAKVKLLPLPVLLRRLQRQLPLLAGGARDLEARQKTMRATLAWSEDLLSPEEQRLFCRLAVFASGFTLEAAEAVCLVTEGAKPLTLDLVQGLGALLDQSLLQQREEGGEARFSMLHVIREYALEHLEASGEAEALCRAHATYCLAVAEEVEPWLLGGPRLPEALVCLEREHGNCRAALTWARDCGEVDTGMQLATRLARFWRARGYLSEGRTWLEELLGMAGVAGLAGAETVGAARLSLGETTGVWVRAANAAGWLALWQGDDGRAARWLEMAATTARAAGDARTAADALHGLGILALQRGNYEQAAALLEPSLVLAHEANNASDIVQGVLRDRGWVAYFQGDLTRATACFEEGLALIHQIGDQWGEAIWQTTLGELALRAGDLTQAVILEREALKRFVTLGTSIDMVIALELLAMAAGAAGKYGLSARLFGAATSARIQVGAPLAEEARKEMEQAAASARAALGEDAWEEAFAVGRALALEEAIAEALGDEGTAAEGEHEAN
jgi:predicted ATPase/class 3 adenylate cyclase